MSLVLETLSEFEFVSRYGDSLLDPDTMCKGQCEGTGWVPIADNDYDEPWRSLWLKAEQREPTDDGWHFAECPECCGTEEEQNENMFNLQRPQ